MCAQLKHVDVNHIDKQSVFLIVVKELLETTTFSATIEKVVI